MIDIHKQEHVQVDNTEVYKVGDKVKETDCEYSVIMIILSTKGLSVIKNETGILH